MYTVIAVFNSLVNEISQSVYKLHCDEVQVFVGIMQQIAAALNRCIYCLLERRIQQEKHIPSIERITVSKKRFKQLNTLPLLHFNCCLTAEYSEMSHNTLQWQLRY
jgi:hypothetical protein